MPVATDHIEIRYRPADTAAAWTFQTIPPGQSSIQLPGVQRGVQYQIEARAVSASGAASDWVGQTHIVDDITLVPLAPTGLTATSAADTVALVWTVAATQRPDVEYEVWRAPDVGGSAGTYAQIGLTRALSYPDHITDGIMRHYKVRAHDFRGNVTAYSNEAASQGKIVEAGATHGATIGPGGNVNGAVDGNGRALIDFSVGHLNKNLDQVGDGISYSRSGTEPQDSIVHLGICSGGSSFSYRQISTSGYTIASGDKLQFDVFIDPSSPSFQYSFDFGWTAGGTFRGTSIADQNGLANHPATDLSAWAKGRWYHRVFDLSSLAGTAVTSWASAHEGDLAGQYIGRLANIRIVNGSTTKKVIYSYGAILSAPVWSGAGETNYSGVIVSTADLSAGAANMDIQVSDGSTFTRPFAKTAEPMIGNPSFEQGGTSPTGSDSGWASSIGNTADMTYETTTPIAGSRTLKLHGTPGNNTQMVNKVHFIARPGDVIMLQATGKVSAAGVVGILGVQFADKNGAGSGAGNVTFNSTGATTPTQQATAGANTVEGFLFAKYDASSTVAGDALFDSILVSRVRSIDNELADGTTYQRMPGANMDGSRRALIDFGSGHLNKNVDFIGDGTTFARVSVNALTGNLVDIAKSGVVGKSVEIVRNPDFESGDRDWTKEAGWSIVQDGNAYQGTWAAKWTGAPGAGSAIRDAIFFAVQPGDAVLAMCLAKRTAGDGAVNVRFSFQNSSGAEIGTPGGPQITSSTYLRSRVVAIVPANAVTARVEAVASSNTIATTCYVDQFYAAHIVKSMAEVPDDATTSRFAVSSIDGNRRGIIDLTQGHLNKNIDNIGDGSTFGRPMLSRLSSGKPLIDFSETIHISKHLGNIPDDISSARFAVAALDAARKAIVDFSQGHLNKNIDNISDGSTRKAVTAIDSNGKAIIDLSQAGHLNKNLGFITDTNNRFAAGQAGAMGDGFQILSNPDFAGGSLTGYIVYDNLASGKVTLSAVADTAAPNSTGFKMQVSVAAGGGISPGSGGFTRNFGPDSGAFQINTYHRGSTIIFRIIANIPVGWNITWASNATGTGSTFTWLTPVAGTGDWVEYVAKLVIGASGTFATTGFFYIDNGVNNTAVTWFVSVCSAICMSMPAGVGIPGANVDSNRRALVDFSQGHLNKNIDQISDGSSRKAVTSIDGSGRAIVDFGQAHLNKNLDQIADTASYRRVGAGSVDVSARPLIDFSLGAHLNKSQDFIPDGATFFRTTANQRDGGGRGFNAIDSGNVVIASGLDFSRSYTGKHMGNIPDDAGSARFAVSAIDAARKSIIDFSQGHSNKNLDNIADTVTYQRKRPASPRAVDTPYNSDFEIWPDNSTVADGWTKDFEINTAGSTYSRGAGFFGNFGQSIATVAGNGGSVASRPVAVRPNTKYEISARYVSNVATTTGLYIRVCWYLNDGDFSRGSTSVSSHPLDDVLSAAPTSTGWQFAADTFTSPADAKYAVVAFYNYLPNVNATFTFDSVNIRPADTGNVDGGVDASGNLKLKNIAQANGSTSAPTSTSTTYATLAEMSIARTTKGNSVLVTFSGLFETTGSTGSISIQLYRDGTAISNEIFQQSPAASQAFVLSLTWLDSPSAASHTYELKWHGGPTYTSIAIGTSRAMQLVELG